MESEEENFYKLIAFLVDVCPKVVCNYFKRKVLCGDTFESYLNKRKHILYHLNCTNKKCCECTTKVVQQKQLSNDNFKSLFDEDLNKKVHHGKNCICIYAAKKSISPAVVLDISLGSCMLKNCEHLDNDIGHWLDTLKNTRNKVVHSTDTKSINDLEFNYHWQIIQGAVFGLAKSIDDEYEKTVAANVEYLSCRKMLSDDKLKECQLLHDWWRDKCCDIEKIVNDSQSQLTSVYETARTLNENESRHHSEIKEKIDNIDCKIDTLTDMHRRSNKDDSDTNSGVYEGQTFTEYDKKDIQVVMKLEANQSFCEADVESKFLLPLKTFLNSIDSKINIKSFSTCSSTAVGHPIPSEYLLPSASGSSYSLNPPYERHSEESLAPSNMREIKKKAKKPIFVKNEWNGDVKMFWLSDHSKIRELKSLIQIEIGIRPENQVLLFEGTQLKDDITISYSGVSNKIVYLKQEEAKGISMFTTVMRELARGYEAAGLSGLRFIYVLTKKDSFIEIDVKNCITVFEIKDLIFEKEGIPYYKQVLYNGTKILEDGQHIKNCGIKEGQRLTMYYYLRFPAPVTQPQICT